MCVCVRACAHVCCVCSGGLYNQRLVSDRHRYPKRHGFTVFSSKMIAICGSQCLRLKEIVCPHGLGSPNKLVVKRIPRHVCISLHHSGAVHHPQRLPDVGQTPISEPGLLGRTQRAKSMVVQCCTMISHVWPIAVGVCCLLLTEKTLYQCCING